MRDYPYLEIVESGIQYLDGAYPGWLERVDEIMLDNDDAILHVLAQVTGRLIYETDEAQTWTQDALARNGFVAKLLQGGSRRLTAEWQYQIRMLKTARKVARAKPRNGTDPGRI